MLNQFVLEGKCIIEPFQSKDDCDRSFVQINILNNDSILCVRAYNKKMMNQIEMDVRKGTNLLITGYVDSVLSNNDFTIILKISEYSVTYL